MTGDATSCAADPDALKADLYQHAGKIKGEVLSLKDLAHAFERWRRT